MARAAAQPVSPYDARRLLKTRAGQYVFYSLDLLQKGGYGKIDRLPFSIRIMLESVLRNWNGKDVTSQDVTNLAQWKVKDADRPVMPFFPGRVILQDFTGVPLIVDLAAMRSAMLRMGGDPKKINPVMPVDLVIDHSVQVDYYAIADALKLNAKMEFQRNRERYELLHWAQKAFDNFKVVPPSTGIVHQVNLEYLSKVVLTRQEDGAVVAFPDTLVGTDSHTTMVNGLGVVGWGVGGIEAEAAMLGFPNEMLVPDVIGFKLSGHLPEGTTPTDLTLTITQILRKKGVVNKFVEFYGPGLTSLPLPDRAMIGNMSPENGATITFFPVDEQSLEYLRLTGRPAELVELVEAYCKEQHLFRTDSTPDPEFTDTLELDLSKVEPSVAGPKRPQDRLPLSQVKTVFKQVLTAPRSAGGYAVRPEDAGAKATAATRTGQAEITHGDVVIAAITSCTNTSDPFVMVGAGLLAKNALEKGLKTKPYVKTSLAPGSRVVTEYLKRANLLEPLDKLGFALVGYGCTTCIGNSGPMPEEIAQAITSQNLVVASVLSGNRNFEGRINPYTQANYLASPPLVVAYALAGTVNIDLSQDSLGTGKDGRPVYLKDIWPSSSEIMETVSRSITPQMFKENYADLYTANQEWNKIASGDSPIYRWDAQSTYVQEPPYFEGLASGSSAVQDIQGARALAVLGDSVTTDHISPAGSIPAKSPAGKYLIEHGVAVEDFNSYGSRRGNDQVMVRGTFANIRLKNQLVPEVEGGVTLHLPDKQQMTIFDAAMKYKEEGVPLVIIAGKEYGTGSSRDWAAKGTMLLGVKAVIAESYERIHRSNLVGMGLLPLQFKPGENAKSLGLTGRELYSIEGLSKVSTPGGELTVRAVKEDGAELKFKVDVRLSTEIDLVYFRNGGLMQTVLLELLEHA